MNKFDDVLFATFIILMLILLMGVVAFVSYAGYQEYTCYMSGDFDSFACQLMHGRTLRVR